MKLNTAIATYGISASITNAPKITPPKQEHASHGRHGRK